MFLVTGVEQLLLELGRFGFGLDLGTGLGADFRNMGVLATRSLVPTGKCLSTLGVCK